MQDGTRYERILDQGMDLEEEMEGGDGGMDWKMRKLLEEEEEKNGGIW